jgi:YidC/Oxa1 family membrane protein insertase
MGELFNELIIRPLLNLTVFLYGTIGLENMALTIIIVTILVRLALLPLSLKTARSQKAMAQVAPEVERIREQYKNDTQAQSEATMRLYKERGVSPLSGCLPLLLQLPILIGMYRVFTDIFKPEALAALYRWVDVPAEIIPVVFGFLNMSAPSHVLAVTAAVAQFFQMKLTGGVAAEGRQAAMNKQMMYMLPVMILVIGWSLPAGLSLYWITTTLFSLGEQLYLRRASGILAQ